MRERIPQRIDYHRYTEQGVVIGGVISQDEFAKDLPRFNGAIIGSTGDVKYYLAFDTDILGNRFVTGHVEAQVILQCQRCMDDYTLDLNCSISIAFVKNDFEQKQAEESNYDVYWLERKELFDPRILIEDELLLALPQIPMHSESEIGKECDVQVQFLDENEEYDVFVDAADASADRKANESTQKMVQKDEDNPFAILKQLKK